MHKTPTRTEYAVIAENANHPDMNSDFMYECFCEFIRNIDAAHERDPESSYESLAREYIEWLKAHR